MARKQARKGASKKTGRRRKVSGPGGDQLMNVLVGVGGALAGTLLVNMVNKSLKNSGKDEIKPEITGLVMGAAGLYLVPMISKDPMVKMAGVGMAIAGGFTAVKTLAKIGNTGYTVRVPRRALPPSGDGITRMVAGDGITRMVAGDMRATPARRRAAYAM